jgi:hypothetical protein
MNYFPCPHCRYQIDADDVIGGSIECPKCGTLVSPVAKKQVAARVSSVSNPTSESDTPIVSRKKKQRPQVSLPVPTPIFQKPLAVASAVGVCLLVGLAFFFLASKGLGLNAVRMKMNEVVKVGDWEVSLEGAQLCNAEARDAIGQFVYFNGEPRLHLYLHLTNTNKTLKHTYPGSSDLDPRLSDEHGNLYRVHRYSEFLYHSIRPYGQINPRIQAVQGTQLEGETVFFPATKNVDMLTFERPVPQAKILTLELDTSSLGGGSTLIITIPADSIVQG